MLKGETKGQEKSAKQTESTSESTKRIRNTKETNWHGSSTVSFTGVGRGSVTNTNCRRQETSRGTINTPNESRCQVNNGKSNTENKFT